MPDQNHRLNINLNLLSANSWYGRVAPGALRLLCILEVLMKLVKSSYGPSEVALDELTYD